MTTESLRWFTSSYSGNGGNCVEVATNLAPTRGIVPVRDSKDSGGPILTVETATWSTFVRAVKGDGFPA